MTDYSVIDVCLVASRRPDLLSRTLESFSMKLFRNFTIGKFIANLDPIFGDLDAHLASLSVIRSFCPQAEIAEPERAGFCQAVRRNWLRSRADIVFHLEDDWILHQKLEPEWVRVMFKDRKVAQVCFENANLKRREGMGDFRYKLVPKSICGRPVGRLKRRIPAFTTSPSFMRGDFARAAARLLDCAYDPEKQFFAGVNPALEKFASSYKCRLCSFPEGYLISDIGREWRAERGVAKVTENAVSLWLKE